MAGTFTLKQSDGQLPAAKTALYSCPVETQAIIKIVTLVNTSGGTRTVNLYLNANGTSRRIIPNDLSLGVDHLLEADNVYMLEAGDAIEGDSDTADVVDYTISITEET